MGPIEQTLTQAIERLSDGIASAGGSYYSCHAIEYADVELGRENNTLYLQIMEGLRAMGLNPDSASAFDDVKYGAERQRARALWLTWAALMAKEQGV